MSKVILIKRASRAAPFRPHRLQLAFHTFFSF
jgi:hypothetical protein